MYQDKMAFAIKVNGKVLREQAETVFLPFGCEYSLLIKNLNNRRACVRITIDGKEAVDGGLIVNANSSVDLERFVEAGQLNKGLRFKFIERTAKVEEHRGIEIEDGLIRVEFEYERERVVYTTTPYTKLGGSWNDTYGSDLMKSARSFSSGSLGGSLGGEVKTSSGIVNQAYASNASFSADESAPETGFCSRSVPQNDAGITVGGSLSEQKFVSTHFDGDGKTEVMVMRLLGEVNEKPVVAPVTVRTKTKCHTCGHVNKASAKFCPECGTGLEIV